MADDTSYLLTDEFIAFSKVIAEIHEKKKAKKLELKSIVNKFQQEIVDLEEEAKQAELKFKNSIKDKE
jgi:hypothetical protein